MENIKEQSGQMAVEFALVAPILIITGLILFMLSQYLYLSNKFNHVARQIIVVECVSPLGNETQKEMDGRIQSLIEKQLNQNDIDIEVVSEYIDVKGNVHDREEIHLIPYLKKYTCTMAYHPLFPKGKVAYASINSPFTLNYSCEIVVDPYRSGILV